MIELDGPRREPQGSSAHSLVILLHGYGANGEDLIALADAWQGQLPHTVFVSPNAPERLPFVAASAFQWFPLTLRDPDEYIRGALAVAPVLQRFIDAQLARYRLDPHRLALVGFSQGTMMALHVGLRRANAPAAIVGFSGVIAGPDRLSAELACRPPVLLIHGAADEVIPVEACHLTRETLAAAGVPVEWHIRPGLGHGIDPEGLKCAGRFLVEHIGAPY
ncbi:MAG TPA: dienelactone hydrolase family protein [Hyphomicrobiaceae bacterium]|nr:dienelactone hydrolase family protein [Hyphomicrobiaceae bacterium]